MIYDEESDRHVHITFEQAMYATGYGDDNGPTADIFGVQSVGTEAKAKMTTVAADGTVTEDTAATGAVDTLAEAYKNDTVTTTKIKTFVTAMITAVNKGTWVPIEIVIARPFIEHLMLSAIVAVAGRETGATLFGCAVRPRMRRSALHPTPLAERTIACAGRPTCRSRPTPP